MSLLSWHAGKLVSYRELALLCAPVIFGQESECELGRSLLILPTS